MLQSLVRTAGTHHSWHHKHTIFSSLIYSSKAHVTIQTHGHFRSSLRRTGPSPATRRPREGPLSRRSQRRPLFSSAPSLFHLSYNDLCTYFKLKKDAPNAVLPMGYGE